MTGADLGASSTELLWIVGVYAFLLAGSLITVGTLGDRIGRRRLLLAGAAGYGVASALAAYAPGPELLIADRALMGLTAATLMPSTFALVAVMFSAPRQRTVAISVIVSSVSGGTAIAVLGNLITAVYRHRLGDLPLAGVPVDAAAAARDDLPAAVAVAVLLRPGSDAE